MKNTVDHLPFGEADLTNCERELIHLAGSIQPHGALLVVREGDLQVLQASVNTVEILGREHRDTVGHSLNKLGGDLCSQIESLARSNLLTQATPVRCCIDHDELQLEAMVHRLSRGTLVVELQIVLEKQSDFQPSERLPHLLADAVGQITSTSTLTELANKVVSCVRQLTGYDRVMVYQFDEDGHGEVIAEAKKDGLEPFLGQHYPASDIPQRARDLYVRNRVRVLTDVFYPPVPIAPRYLLNTGEDLDMSLCHLRSMSPMHLQYLKNMGVTATLVASIVREGRLWGLIACHHYSVKAVASELRSACELLSEVVSTRISVLENHSQIEAELLVRSLEHRLVRAATETGDWRDALFEDPAEMVLKPLEASGVALLYQDEILVAGETPSLLELRALAAWLEENNREPVLHTSSLPRMNAELRSLAPSATGLLAVELSRGDGEYLFWFRKEQLRTVTWAGNPDKPVTVGNDPMDLSPRRSFAAWSELVRDTAKPWTATELAIASAIRSSLVDVILQMRAMRALIADRQASSTLRVIESAGEPMILADGEGKILILNDAFHRLVERPLLVVNQLNDLFSLCADQSRMREIQRRISTDRKPWRGELRLLHGASGELPVAVRADPVPGVRGDIIGYIMIFTDLRLQREARAARARLERAIAESNVTPPLGGVAAMLTNDFDELLSAILANASAAIMQITDTTGEVAASGLLRELESATRRAAELTAQILGTVSRYQQSN